MKTVGFIAAILAAPVFLWIWGKTPDSVIRAPDKLSELTPTWITKPMAAILALIIFVWPVFATAGVASMFGLTWEDVFGE